MNLTRAYTEEDYTCDEYYGKNNVSMVRGIKGMSSGIFNENVAAKWHDGGDAISKDEVNEPEWNLGGNAKLGYITTDVYTTFTILVGIFFPSCTGIYRVTMLFRDNVLLTLFLKFRNLPFLPNSHQPKQKWACNGTTRLKSIKHIL